MEHTQALSTGKQPANLHTCTSQSRVIFSIYLQASLLYRIVSCIRRTFFHGGEYQKSGVRLNIRVQQNPTFIFSVTRSGMLPPFISDAKDAPDIYS